MNKKQLDVIVHYSDIASVIVVAISVLAIIFAAIKLFRSSENVEKITVMVEYKFVTDPNRLCYFKDSTSSYYMREIVKNNDRIYSQINSLLSNQQERIDAIQKSDKSRSEFISYASAIFALIISIAGFFGYKSMLELKKAAIEIATEDAKKAAIEEAKAAFTEIQREYDEILQNRISTISNDIIRHQLSTINDEISSIKDRLDERINNEPQVQPEILNTDEPNNEPPFNDEQV
ncbi:MAG: hypothetical protein AB9834_19230 [Lentimicrobium sp.]